MEQILYGNPSNSADEADIVALYLTDLVVTEENEKHLQYLLSNALRDREHYVCNEEDSSLTLKHIPAQLTHISGDESRFASLSVAVHRRNVEDYDGNGALDHHDCFPLPPYLTCKSPRSDLAARGKTILAQDLVITRGGTAMDVVLLAANLDPDDASRAMQLSGAQRLLRARQGTRPFSALIWGDLGNRLVAFEELAPHARSTGPRSWELLDSGVDLLAGMIEDPALRRELLTKDSLLFTGRDILGRPFITPDCNVLLRELFLLHIDSVQGQGLAVPLPSYKRSPLDRTASELLGCEATCPHVGFPLPLTTTSLCRWISSMAGLHMTCLLFVSHRTA